MQSLVKPILKQPEVCRVTGLSRSSVYRLEALDDNVLCYVNGDGSVKVAGQAHF